MSKRILKTAGILFFLISTINLYSQDVEFSQFYASKVYLNPAFAGSDFDARISMNYRNQWPEINSAYVTYSVAYDQYVNAVGGGIGLQVMQDEQGNGTISTTTFSSIYSYSLRISKNLAVRTGFQSSFIHRKLNNANFIFPDQTDEFHINGLIRPFTEESTIDHLSRNYIDFSSGLIASYKNWFVGFAAHHLTEPEETHKEESDYSKLPRKYTLHCGVNIPVLIRNLHQSEINLSPNFLYRQQGINKQFNYGLYLSRESLIFGMWYRDNLSLGYDAVILQLGLMRDWWQFAYSYDKTISNLIHTNTGAHEISFLIRLENSKRNKTGCQEVSLRKRRKAGRIKCPDF